MLDWLPKRDRFLAELLRHEGRGDIAEEICWRCRTRLPQYRCRDCYGSRLTCGECTRATHVYSPLHRIQVSLRINSLCNFMTDVFIELEWRLF